MGLLDFLFGIGDNKDIQRELNHYEDIGGDELEGLRNKEIRREKLYNYEYHLEEGEEDL